MQTRGGARPKRGRDSQGGQAQAGDHAYGPQAEAPPHDDLRDDTPAQPLTRPQLGFAEESEQGQASPQAQQPAASEQQAAASTSPGCLHVAPPGLGRLACIVTPVGDMNGIDESAPGVVSHVWDDDPECSSTSSAWPSAYFQSRTHRTTASPAPPLPTPTVASTPTETLQMGGGPMVPYAPPAPGTASSSNQSISSSNLERLMEGLRNAREADELAKRADEVAKAIEDEQHEVRLRLQAFRRAQGQAGPSRQAEARRRKQPTPRQKNSVLTATENAFRDNTPDASWRVLHERHSRRPVHMLPAPEPPPAEQAPAPMVCVRTDVRPPFGRYPLVAQEAPEARAGLDGDQEQEQAAWYKAGSAISDAVEALVPPALGRNKKGGVIITSKMRDATNKKRAACQLVGALSLQTCSAVLDRNLTEMAEKLHDDELYGTECADELVNFFARWGVSTLKGALSALTRLRAFAEMKGEYEAVDSDEYPAQLVSAFLDDLDARAIKAAEALQEKAEAEGVELTVQQQRRDGRSAAKTAFRSLRFLLDNAKMVTAARDSLVYKRRFAATVPMPTPALEPPHYVQLCYLAAHHVRTMWIQSSEGPPPASPSWRRRRRGLSRHRPAPSSPRKATCSTRPCSSTSRTSRTSRWHARPLGRSSTHLARGASSTPSTTR